MILESKNIVFVIFLALAGSGTAALSFVSDINGVITNHVHANHSDPGMFVVEERACTLDKPRLLSRDLKKEGVVKTLKLHEQTNVMENFYINNQELFSN